MKAVIFEQNNYDVFFQDIPHIHRAIADHEEGKFHICDKCKSFIFKGILIREADNLCIQLWTDFASRCLGTDELTIDVFKNYELTNTCRIIGEIEIPPEEADILIRRAKQFDKIDGFWSSHKNKIWTNLRKALFKQVKNLVERTPGKKSIRPLIKHK